jgi:hypothetical protein
LGEVVGEEGAEACREEGRGGELGVVFGVHGWFCLGFWLR